MTRQIFPLARSPNLKLEKRSRSELHLHLLHAAAVTGRGAAQRENPQDEERKTQPLHRDPRSGVCFLTRSDGEVC